MSKRKSNKQVKAMMESITGGVFKSNLPQWKKGKTYLLSNYKSDSEFIFLTLGIKRIHAHGLPF
jgi:hypothetical protein